MFRIECFCDDTKLGKVLMALNGLAYDVMPTPVANAKVIGGKVRQTNGSAVEALVNGISKHKYKDVGVAEMRAIMVENGFSEGGYSNALTQARAKRLIKKVPSTTNKYPRWTLAKVGSAS